MTRLPLFALLLPVIACELFTVKTSRGSVQVNLFIIAGIAVAVYSIYPQRENEETVFLGHFEPRKFSNASGIRPQLWQRQNAKVLWLWPNVPRDTLREGAFRRPAIRGMKFLCNLAPVIVARESVLTEKSLSAI